MPLFNNLGILTGSIYLYKDGDALASGSKLTISPDFTTTGKYDFIYETSGSTSVKLLTLSSSGQDPRIGIGNENPKTTLDLKEVKDNTVGAEILIRSSRTTKGGDVGDGAGKILFVIDSGSYNDVKTSGSVAIITTEVTAINDKMAGGDLLFKVSDKNLFDPEPSTILTLFRDTSIAGSSNNFITASADFLATGNVTGGSVVKGNSLNSTTSATIGTFVYADNIRVGSNTAPTTKGLYVSGNITSSNDLSIRGFPSVSASLASITASYVNTLNQNVLITGNLTIGSSSIGSNENTLILGPSPAGGTGEGGQLLLQASGGVYTSASMLDNYQNQTRLLRGTNAGSDDVVASWNMHSKQMRLPAYNSTTAFTATSLVGILGFDANGNILTTNTSSGGGGGGVTILNNTDNYLVTATGTANTLNGEANLQFNGSSLTVTGNITASGTITAQANNQMYFRGGDDAELWDINVMNTLGVYGQQNADRAGLKLGSSGPTLFGLASRLGIGTITPTSASLTVDGNIWAISFTGSLLGTASYALNTPPAPPQPILLIYTSSTNLISTPPSGYILEIDNLPDYVRLNTQSFNGINLAPVGFGDFYFNQPGSLLTIRATGSGAFKTYKIVSYANSSNYAEYVVQLSNIISSGTLNNGDVVEFKWDKSADVGNLTEGNVTDVFGTYNAGAIDLFFSNASGILPGLNEISTLSYTGSGYIGASITRSANLTIRSLNATTAITSSIISASGGITGSLFGTASWANNSITSSLANRNILTASVSSNIITFTKGDGSTFNLTVNTGSGGGGGVTINNNVDTYLVTATGTSNTLDGESNLTFDGVTLTVGGNISSTAIDVRDDPSTTIGDYAVGSHIARDWVAAGGPALTAGNIVYFSGSQQWANAQANATGSSTRVLGVVTSNADPNEIVLQGTVTVNTDLATYQIGQPVYLSPLTAGRVTNVPPSSSGHVARYVGWVVDTSRDQIYFNPDFTYIQL